MITFMGFVLSVVVVIAVWYTTDRFYYKRAQNLFENYVNDSLDITDAQIHKYENALRSGVGFMQGSDYVSRNEWHQFVETLDIQKYYFGMQGIGYSIMLAPDQVASTEKRMRDEGYPSFVLKPSGMRDIYSSILYLEPMDKRNQAAIGYDMYSEPVRREAMQRAIDTGSVSISGKVKLVQEIDQAVQAGYLMYLPFYKTGEAIDTLTKRRHALIGFVYSPFRMNDLMNTVKDHQESIRIEIYDGPQRTNENLLYREASIGYRSVHTSHRTIDIGGRTWYLYYYSTEKFDRSTNTFVPLLIAMIGLGLYFILFYIILELLRSRRMLQQKSVELESRRSWFQGMLESSVDGIHILDLDGKLIECSPSFLQMLGYDKHDVPELSVYDWDAKSSYEEMQFRLHNVSTIPITFETLFRHRNGIVFDVEITVCRIELDGLRYVYASARVIVERKIIERVLRDSEEFYRTMFTSINEAVCILSDDIIIDCNDQAAVLFETSKEYLVGKNIFNIATNIECRENSFAFYLDEAYLRNSANMECSITLTSESNEVKIVEIILSGFGHDDRNKLVMLAKDITERIEKDKLFKMQTRQAQMGEMISMIAHQWRQPLAIINAMTAQMRLRGLMNGDEGSPEQENLQKIEQQCIHLSQTITDYRDFFRPDKPNEMFSLSTLIKHALDLIDHTLKNQGIETEVISLREQRLVSYRNEVLQVLIALLKNSIDAFEENGITHGKITVTIDQEENYSTVAIRDNAGGIIPEAIKKIFVPYFTTKNKEYGTGLGLYMSKVIIEEHCKGLLQVMSKGMETTFSIKLPNSSYLNEDVKNV
ncbi:MAG: CHASE domain-containing protein [Sulfuricurvum sp.]|uniref:CHASE domain-containing protein n=1 Tax=Sulfuricurvum sp. TaxID=2025608 RepID=UPI0026299BA6|nr:CHASE domain-containing protein [Sulfuricurvum sp.]MDD2829735.1 CHASE domain-containing protein [Sulfuricurvum sp.]MDD4949205.1 CHASE domain-containing protein [Sulfuricurvum sp.]